MDDSTNGADGELLERERLKTQEGRVREGPFEDFPFGSNKKTPAPRAGVKLCAYVFYPSTC